ncbi:MAG TPA: tetratricopeptide repeat protein [Myxococcota bacterium]|nr:tetratricopeptide repeat protein [Myxococcota bacterium]
MHGSPDAHGRRAPSTLVAVLCLLQGALGSGCAAPTSGRLEPRVVVEEVGFSITEGDRLGLGARADFERAVEAIEKERYGEAIELLSPLAEKEPGATAVHVNLGIAHAGAGDLGPAAESLERAIALNPRHPVAWNELGIVHRRAGRFEQARASYQEALGVHPEFHFARRNLGILCDLYLRDPACALEHYELYLESVPEDEKASMWVADLERRIPREEDGQ